MKKTPKYRSAEVVSSHLLTPHLQRVVLTGEDFSDFPENEEGGYVKVILEGTKEEIEASDKRPKMKSYTVAHFDKTKKELTLDFAANLHEGQATNWAKNAKPGDKIVLAGPGPRKIYDFPQTDYLMFCDLTSINAVRAYLNLVPESATGKAIIFVPTLEDIQKLPTRSQISIEFITEDSDDLYAKHAMNYTELSSKTIVFAGGEHHKVMALRNFLFKEKELPQDNVFISSYWKRGMNDEEFRKEKKANRSS